MSYFINGGNSGPGTPYVGAAVADVPSALTLLRTEILASGEGWIIGDVDDIGGSLQFSVDGTGTENNKVRILFKGNTGIMKPGFADGTIEMMVRDLDSSGSLTGAVMSFYLNSSSVQVDSGGNNLLFAAIEPDAIVLCTIPGVGFATGVWMGMVDRFDPTDSTAIYGGYTNTYGYVTESPDLIDPVNAQRIGEFYTYTAVAVADGAINQRLTRGFANVLNTGATLGPVTFQRMDAAVTAALYMSANTDNTLTWWGDNGRAGASFNGHQGKVNSYASKPVIEPYYIWEGAIMPTRYNIERSLFCKGAVKNVVRGMAYLNTGIQWETNSGAVYMSTGASNPGGWMGMRIA